MPTVKQIIKRVKEYTKKSPKISPKISGKVAAETAIRILEQAEQNRSALAEFATGEFYEYTSQGAVREQKERPPSKYRNKKTVVDGITFASKKEANRYGELKILLRAGIITGLEMQRRYPLVVNGLKICTYISDFDYFNESNKAVVEDVKGVRTREYILKKKLMLACYGIEIKEV